MRRLRGGGRDAPAIRSVAFGALGAGMVGRSRMARLAVIIVAMGKGDFAPVLDIVAVGALAGPVAGRWNMA